MESPPFDLVALFVRLKAKQAIALAEKFPHKKIALLCSHPDTYMLAQGYIAGHYPVVGDLHEEGELCERIDVLLNTFFSRQCYGVDFFVEA